MFRVILRVIAVLFLLGGLMTSAIAGYLLFTPSKEDTLYEQRLREMTEKYEQAQAAKSPAEKTRLLKESQEAAGWAKAWGEGARTRRKWHQLGMGVGVVVVFFGLVVFALTFVGRKARTAPA